MKKPLVICGDSFNIGIGCLDLKKEPYGSLLADHFDVPLVNLAKGSSSNYSIFLQALYAAELSPGLVIVSATSYDRMEFMPADNLLGNPDVRDVNYHAYPPYGPNTYPVDQSLSHPFVDDVRYVGNMFTDQYGAFFDYKENGSKAPEYYARFRDVPTERLDAIREFFLEAYDGQIKRDYDLGMMAWAHTVMRARSIPHIILCHDDRLTRFLPEENYMALSWFELAKDYPDDIGSMHASPEGHRFVFEQIKDKIVSENLLRS